MTPRIVPFGLTGLALFAASACEAPQFACETPRVPLRVAIPSADVDEVDLLLVVDDSASMDGEQAALVAELPRLVEALASGDRDGDGVRDFDPVRSLHVGVVTTDLGAGPNDDVATCARGLGDDGILQTRSAATTAPCSAGAPSSVFEFDPLRDDVSDFAAGVGCAARQAARAACSANHSRPRSRR
jgi:hypothetical protein